MTPVGVKLKNAVKVALKSALMALPVQHPTNGFRILTYHSIGYRNSETNVTPAVFREHMSWLRDHYPVVSLLDAAEYGSGVAVTLDDGYQDNLLYAAPILNECKIPATVFVVAGSLGRPLWDKEDPETSRLLDEQELVMLHNMGISIGAHGMTHRRLAALTTQEQEREIKDSVNTLTKILKTPVREFAYPFGTAADYTQETIRLVAQTTCVVAVSNRYGVNPEGSDVLNLMRIPIDATDTIRLFKAKVQGKLDALRFLETSWALKARRFLNALVRA